MIHRIEVGTVVRYVENEAIEAVVLKCRAAARRTFSNVRVRIIKGDATTKPGTEFDSVSKCWLKPGEKAQ